MTRATPPSAKPISAAVLLAAVALLLHTAVALGARPMQDDYLESVTLGDPATGLLPTTTVVQRVDTTEATEQADMFSSQGTGGGPEPLHCRGVTYGKTVWWDFRPPADGFVFINAVGYDTVVHLFEWDPSTARIIRDAGCSTEPEIPQSFSVRVAKGRLYTIQVGGAGGASGQLQMTVDFFADRDGDTTFDRLDRCPNLRGTERDGCPPTVEARPLLAAGETSRGVYIQSLTVTATKGSRLSLRCRRGCRIHQVRRGRRVAFSGIAGKTLSAGAVFELRVTKAGHIGRYFRWTVRRRGVPRRVDRCLPPSSTIPRRRCR